MSDRSYFIKKVWGQEEIICSRGKIMHLDKGAQCSLHFHKIKEEVFGCLSGEVRMQVGEMEYIMSPGDIVRIPIGTHHSFTGIQDSKIVEISYQDDDVNDSYRLTESKRNVL